MTIFDRIVCGVDATPASLEAVRRATRLQPPGGRLVLVSVADEGLAVLAGAAAAQTADALLADAQGALEAASSLAPQAGVRVIEGFPVPVLLDEIERVDATLVAIGTHDVSRPVGIVVRAVSTSLLHEAPCSVLVARPARDPDSFPSSIVLGLDGSPGAAVAAAAASKLADRLGAEVPW